MEWIKESGPHDVKIKDAEVGYLIAIVPPGEDAESYGSLIAAAPDLFDLARALVAGVGTVAQLTAVARKLVDKIEATH